MRTQYDDKGLKLILVDESYRSKARNDESLQDFIRDHELEGIPIISDGSDMGIATKYGVTMTPSSFLLVNGTVRKGWEGIALPAQLAFAVEEVLKK
jgi:hypothetical protein